MSEVLEFIIVQKAKSKGGDKYACVSNPEFTIYVPQSISRKGSNVEEPLENPRQKLKITIE